MLCDKCKHGMREVEHMHSGNSVFKTFQCTYCTYKVTKCQGLSIISTI
ncbi:MAG: hypothetical protein KJ583_02755 [Nanoarchaeota archaeon]|nr:hypothetical protein [Nanoarchaeota archaeon]MBU1269258.1 hypothetical protein [Nanoarchaeota archaeon]MBU1604214.1 hypothetical protein [Nanoarchaeota archaeon]MBU2443271.1 hypothetical protein [Nanoarchaeota archaeon]